jgi:hypothetical protein
LNLELSFWLCDVLNGAKRLNGLNDLNGLRYLPSDTIGLKTGARHSGITHSAKVAVRNPSALGSLISRLPFFGEKPHVENPISQQLQLMPDPKPLQLSWNGLQYSIAPPVVIVVDDPSPFDPANDHVMQRAAASSLACLGM